MVHSRHKYKWRNREQHLSFINMLKKQHEDMIRSIEFFENMNGTYTVKNPLSLHSDNDSGTDDETRFERESGTTIPDAIYMKVEE